MVKICYSRVIISRYSLVVILFVLLWPVLFSYLLNSDMFGLAWNAGRGGFLIATILIVIEVTGSRPIIRGHEIKMLIIIAILIGLYFFGLSFGGLDILSNMGRASGVLVEESWKSMWDYVVLAIYFLSVLMVVYGKKGWIRIGGASTFFLFGYATILLLDSVFPYDTLGIFQFLIPPYLNLNAGILDLITDRANHQPDSVSQVFNNTLVLYTPNGPFVMKVYWPSAGVHSIIIFSLVLFAFFLKTNIPGKRTLVYLASGILLTFAVNAIRITLLSLYALDQNSDLSSWEQFHSVIGEILFIPWIILYIVLVICLEKRHYGRRNLSLLNNSDPNNVRDKVVGSSRDVRTWRK
jgi:thaumarchaeosortase